MKLFFANIWKYIAILLAGILTGVVFAVKYLERQNVTTLNTNSYVAELEQKIAKLKQRGEGNTQDVIQQPAKATSGKETRRAIRAYRKALKNQVGKSV